MTKSEKWFYPFADWLALAAIPGCLVLSAIGIKGDIHPAWSLVALLWFGFLFWWAERSACQRELTEWTR